MTFFLGIAWVALLFHQCTPQWNLSNGLSNDPNEDRMQKLCLQEVGLPIYHFGVNKTIGVPSSRVVFRVFSTSMLYVKRLFGLIENSLANVRSRHISFQR